MVDGRRAADVDLTDVAVTSAALLGGYAKRLIAHGEAARLPGHEENFQPLLAEPRRDQQRLCAAATENDFLSSAQQVSAARALRLRRGVPFSVGEGQMEFGCSSTQLSLMQQVQNGSSIDRDQSCGPDFPQCWHR